MAKKAPKRHQQAVHMGLGEAIQRLLQVEFAFRSGSGHLPAKLLEERAMLLEALNVIPVEVGFDCNSDNVPDNVDIFEQAAHTSCCRILSLDNSRSTPPAPPPKATSRSAPKRKETTEGQTPSVSKSLGADLASVPVAVEPAPKKRGVLNRLFKKESPQ